jgi:hypothetical protein
VVHRGADEALQDDNTTVGVVGEQWPETATSLPGGPLNVDVGAPVVGVGAPWIMWVIFEIFIFLLINCYYYIILI